jgi:hypothetical protein
MQPEYGASNSNIKIHKSKQEKKLATRPKGHAQWPKWLWKKKKKKNAQWQSGYRGKNKIKKEFDKFWTTAVARMDDANEF